MAAANPSQYCLVVGGMGLGIGIIFTLLAFLQCLLNGLDIMTLYGRLLQTVHGGVVVGWGAYFFFVHHDRMLSCDRTVRIIAEVMFYVSLVATALVVCSLFTACLCGGGGGEDKVVVVPDSDARR